MNDALAGVCGSRGVAGHGVCGFFNADLSGLKDLVLGGGAIDVGDEYVLHVMDLKVHFLYFRGCEIGGGNDSVGKEGGLKLRKENPVGQLHDDDEVIFRRFFWYTTR